MRVIQVKVKPSAHESALRVLEDGTYSASLKSPPVDGKANTKLISLVAKHFNAPKSAVTIKFGAGARIKLVGIAIP